jgi:hypothetical protein
MFNNDQHIQYADDRRKELLREARMHQLIRQSNRDRAQMGERLMALLGDLMITSGTKLKARSGMRYRVEPQNS